MSWRRMAKGNNVFKEAYNRCLGMMADGQSLPSESDLGDTLGVSRTTVRAILTRLSEQRLIAWNKRSKEVLRAPTDDDFFPESETDSLSRIIERGFMHRVLVEGAEAGTQISELDLAREIGVGTSSVREFLIRFRRFGLIEKRRNSHWVLKGFTPTFALELTEIREMFEMRSALAFAKLDPSSHVWGELDALEIEHRAMAAAKHTSPSAFSDLDERFHRLIHSASHNRFIVDFYDVIAMVFHYHYQWNKSRQVERNAVAVTEHLDYIAALKSRDAEQVRRACARHLASARRTLLESIPANSG